MPDVLELPSTMAAGIDGGTTTAVTTEYSHNYKPFLVSPTRKWIPSLDITIAGGKFSASTENQEAFVPHELPPQFVIRRPEWVPNPGQFEGITTQRTDFPVWPNIEERPRSARRAQWVSSSGPFSSETTTRRDFRSREPVGSRYVHVPPQYVPSNLPFDAVSTQRDDFRAVKVEPRQATKPQAYLSSKDDRSFATTTTATYITHRAIRAAPSRPAQRSLPPPRKFTATTTTAEFYQPWELPARPPPPSRIPLHTESPLSSATTYTTSYLAHEIQARPAAPVLAPPMRTSKFTETSTQRADYVAPPPMEREIGKGPASYVSNRETRDFVTTTGLHHGPKESARCEVVGWIGMAKERKADGHVYAMQESANDKDNY
ncbi:hypothetical protein BJ742DRAFT_886524 [Cladochytrium replicatum]|nr:hypothetical protein BJ742DRAFT_886524 [Cladochytrium replicatum]